MDVNEILDYPSGKDGDVFLQQAEELMLNYCIRKEIDGKIVFRYYINEVELYYYNKDNKDESVHPHFFKDRGRFRIHFSGVDITFASDWKGMEDEARELLTKGKKIRSDLNPTLEFNQLKSIITQNNVSYGGLLLREIQLYEKDGELIKDDYSPIMGPWCAKNELFYMEGANLSLVLEPCSPRQNLMVQARSRIGLGKNSKGYREDLKNYFIVKSEPK